MATSVSVSYAKNNLSALLRQVRAGRAITITDRGVPVARIVAPEAARGVPATVIALAERGVVTLPAREPGNWFRGPLPRPRGTLTNAAVEALLEERRTGR